MHCRGDLDGRFLAVEGIFQGDLEIIAQIGTAGRTMAASTAPAAAHSAHAEGFAEDLFENVGELGRAGATAERALAAAHAALFEGGVAHAVIGCALVLVGQDGIGLADFLELGLGLRIARILVRVILHRQLAIGALQRLFVCRTVDTECLVIVAFTHQDSPWDRTSTAFCRICRASV
jgi:hypothetical protein